MGERARQTKDIRIDQKMAEEKNEKYKGKEKARGPERREEDKRPMR